ncbi:MAG: adenylate/guanylate cyclase domain-containing protein [Coleofasciculaceae cyanobacterium]
MNSPKLPAEKGNILIVDDTPDNLRLLSTILQSHGYQVRTAISGQMALKGANIIPPDLILLDINMPAMNGYEVCAELKKRSKTAEIPVIFISALDQIFDKIKAFQVGGVDYITKPFQIEEVIVRIENQLNQQRLSRQLKDQNNRLAAEIAVRQRAEEELFFLLSTTQAIAEAADFSSALSIILRSCCEIINWDLGEAWIPNRDGTLKYAQTWYGTDSDLKEFVQQNTAIAPNVGLPGRTWTSQQTEWIEDVSLETAPVFLRAQSAAKLGLKASFSVPILANDLVILVLIFFNKTAISYQKHLVELVNVATIQLSSLIQRKQTEDALRIAEEKYHSIVENAVEGIFQATPSGRYLSVNSALTRILGYESPEDLINNITDISQQLYVDFQQRQKLIETLKSDNKVKGFESLVYCKNGRAIWISENTRAVRDSEENILYYEGTVSDITERKAIQEALKYQQKETEKVLLNILPEPILKQLKLRQVPIADHFQEVTVLFADIVGFTEFCNRKTPKQLVSVLNIIFSKFDQLAQEYGLEKIKTIGDAYMLVGGLPLPRKDHAQAVAQMALAIQAEMVNINAQIGEEFKLRIGINTGPVVAGVIGLSKFIYDLWGDTVNIASRMETTGIPGKIQVTSATYQQLKEQFIFKMRGRIPIKGKGEMNTYILLSKK